VAMLPSLTKPILNMQGLRQREDKRVPISGRALISQFNPKPHFALTVSERL
jgi:hypothetical protein